MFLLGGMVMAGTLDNVSIAGMIDPVSFTIPHQLWSIRQTALISSRTQQPVGLSMTMEVHRSPGQQDATISKQQLSLVQLLLRQICGVHCAIAVLQCNVKMTNSKSKGPCSSVQPQPFVKEHVQHLPKSNCSWFLVDVDPCYFTSIE